MLILVRNFSDSYFGLNQRQQGYQKKDGENCVHTKQIWLQYDHNELSMLLYLVTVHCLIGEHVGRLGCLLLMLWWRGGKERGSSILLLMFTERTTSEVTGVSLLEKSGKSSQYGRSFYCLSFRLIPMRGITAHGNLMIYVYVQQPIESNVFSKIWNEHSWGDEL